MNRQRKVILYIASSLDGYIARPGDDLEFLSCVQAEGEDYGYSGFLSGTDTVVMGRKTYDWIMKQVDEFPHTDMPAYIISRTRQGKEGNLHYYNGCPGDLIRELKSRPGKNIFIDGGAELVNELLNQNLIDEFIISVIPWFAGDGIRLFHDGRPEQALRLLTSRQYKSGLVQLHYIRLTEQQKKLND